MKKFGRAKIRKLLNLWWSTMTMIATDKLLMMSMSFTGL